MIAQRSILEVLTLLIFVLTDITAAYKILFIPIQQKSHIDCMLAVAKELDSRGHDVHMLQFDQFADVPMKVPGSTVKQFHFKLSESPASREGGTDMEKSYEIFTKRTMTRKASFESLVKILEETAFLDLCTTILSNTDESFRRLKAENFDMVVVDGTVYSICFYLIPHRLGIPWITCTTFPDNWPIRTPWLPSFVPNHYTSFTERMTFLERLQNTFWTSYRYLNGLHIHIDDAILTKYRRYGDFDTAHDLVKRSELFLISSDVLLDYAKPTMPNVIEVGGLTTTEPKPLPNDFQQFMDGAEKGVVVVTFGSMLSNFPQELAQKFVSAFSRLAGYRVVWRMTNSANVTIPSNVMISNWIPQNDALGHPKTKLFIMHGGNNGQFEALYNKVPMLGFHLLADQEYNSKRVEYRGYGLSMNIFDFTADQLLANAKTILTDPKYASRVSRASDIFKSAAETPAKRAAGWIERVLKFGGSYLSSAGSDLSMYQYLLLDVLITCAAIVSIFAVFIHKIMYTFLQKCNSVKRQSIVISESRKKQ